MTFAVLGTGSVGRTLASKLISLGHEVRLGSRSASNEAAAAWVAEAGTRASHGTFAEAAAYGDMVFNCTSGAHSVAVASAIVEELRGKVLVDLANPLDFSGGFPPRLRVVNDDSLGEQLQRALPATRVVKTLNTMNAAIMVDPGSVAGGDHDVFLSGNDAAAKAQVAEVLVAFGWASPIDLGDITTARGVEMWLPLWTRLYSSLGHGDFQLKVAR